MKPEFLTRPVRLGLALTEEATELMVLMDEALGLRFSPDGVATVFLTAALALAGVVDGKPIRVTLCTGANKPYLGWHWKYLRVHRQFAHVTYREIDIYSGQCNNTFITVCLPLPRHSFLMARPAPHHTTLL